MKQITNQKYQISSAYAGEDSIYDKIVKNEKMFPNMYNFFSLGLVYGILHNKKSAKRKAHDIIPFNRITDGIVKDVLDICYVILDDGREEKEIVNEMLSFADGGIEELYAIYDKNGSFQLPLLIEESKNMWEKRIKDLNHINLE